MGMLISVSITARAIFSATWPQSIAPRLPILPRRAAVILLTGGTKKRQQRDINAAITYWQDYKRGKRGIR